jgi:hypothetical protein
VASFGALLHAAINKVIESAAATREIFFIFNPIKVPQKTLTAKEFNSSYRTIINLGVDKAWYPLSSYE